MAYFGEDRPMRDEDWEEFGGLFTKKEFMCKCGMCGEDSANYMRHDYMQSLYILRLRCNFPFIITSGYRCTQHPKEKIKALEGRPYGDHNKGTATDVACYGLRARKLTSMSLGVFNVCGVQQKGPFKGRFLHLAVRDKGVGDYFYSYP